MESRPQVDGKNDDGPQIHQQMRSCDSLHIRFVYEKIVNQSRHRGHDGPNGASGNTVQRDRCPQSGAPESMDQVTDEGIGWRGWFLKLAGVAIEFPKLASLFQRRTCDDSMNSKRVPARIPASQHFAYRRLRQLRGLRFAAHLLLLEDWQGRIVFDASLHLYPSYDPLCGLESRVRVRPMLLHHFVIASHDQ